LHKPFFDDQLWRRDSSFIVPGKGTPPDEVPIDVVSKNSTNKTNTTNYVNHTETTSPVLSKSGWRPVAHAANQDVVVPENGRRRLELLEEFTIPDGESELLLPIEVAPQRLTINGNAPPRVALVNSTIVDGEYGAGHEINITVLFTTAVEWLPVGAAHGDRFKFRAPILCVFLDSRRL
jgi:hypothetical protein